MKKLITITILIFLTITSCRYDRTCENIDLILIDSFAISTINLDSIDNKKNLEAYILDKTNYEEMCNYNYIFNVITSYEKNLIKVPITFFKFCPYDRPIATPDDTLKLQINNKKLKDIDAFKESISFKIDSLFSKYIININTKIPHIIIVWQDDLKLSSFHIIIDCIVESYFTQLNNYTVEFYKKEINCVNKDNLSILKNKFPLKIRFAIKDISEWPPPPPPPPSD